MSLIVKYMKFLSVKEFYFILVVVRMWLKGSLLFKVKQGESGPTCIHQAEMLTELVKSFPIPKVWTVMKNAIFLSYHIFTPIRNMFLNQMEMYFGDICFNHICYEVKQIYLCAKFKSQILGQQNFLDIWTLLSTMWLFYVDS